MLQIAKMMETQKADQNKFISKNIKKMQDVHVTKKYIKTHYKRMCKNAKKTMQKKYNAKKKRNRTDKSNKKEEAR